MGPEKTEGRRRARCEKSQHDSRKLSLLVCVPTLFAILAAIASATAQGTFDWQEQVRQQAAAGKFSPALELVEQRLAENPQDLEAHGWRARILGWMGRLPEAEAEYRRVLESAPNDTDVLLGLANVLAREQRFTEALALLDRAQGLEPRRGDALTLRGRVLRSLGRLDEARGAYRAALTLDPKNTEARAGQAALAPDPRHELRIGSDTDRFNFADTAQAQAISLRSRWSSRWTTSVAGNFYQRFGEDAGKFTGGITYRLGAHDALTAGGAVAHDRGIIPKSEAFFEFGHGLRVSEKGFLRGVETAYHQHWLWYRDARLLTFTGSAVFYLPRDWTWAIAVTAARSRFPTTSAEWQPSGTTRLSFPLHRRVAGNLFFSVGTENFSRVDQIGRFSARTFGGALRFALTSRQDFDFYVFHQDRSQGRTQDTFGFSYAIRF